MTALPFGTRVQVHREIIRVGVTHGSERMFWVLADRRDPERRGASPAPPEWPGEPVPADDGYELEPGPPGSYTRLRRIPCRSTGIVIGSCIRYEGTYHPSTRYAIDDYEQGWLADRRAVPAVPRG